MHHSDEEEQGAEPACGSGIAPLERFVAPVGLTGEQGRHRLAREECLISARNDSDAVLAWLADAAVTDAGYAFLRGSAEKLLNWACYERRVAMSSLEAHDLLEFISFLGAPRPAKAWIGSRATRRKSEAWRPFYGPLKASSQRAVMRAVESLFDWLRWKRYANMSLPLDPWSGIDRRSMTATEIRRPNSEPLCYESWGWIVRHLAAKPPSLSTRLALELLYFAGMKLVDIRTLKESNCLPPSQRFPAWRLHVPSRPPNNPWVYALPPLAKTLCEWFGQRKPSPGSSTQVDCSGTHWEGEPLLPNCDTHLGRVQQIMREASLMAAAAGEMAAARELGRATPFNLRHAIELHGENDQAFYKGIVAHSRLKNTCAILYMDRIPVTRLQILHWWSRLCHLWSAYPAVSTTVDESIDSHRIPRPARAIRELATSIELCAAQAAKSRLAAQPIDGVVGAYRSMDRFIRTHVAPRSNTAIVDWIHRADPKLIASHVRDDLKARTAWAYLLWAFTVEPTIARRRWRLDWPVYARSSWTIVPSTLAVVPTDAKTLDDDTVQRRALAKLIAVWHQASFAARTAAVSGYVYWGPGTIEPDLEGASQATPEDILAPAQRRSKQQRVVDYEQEMMQRRQARRQACAGMCLVYGGTKGWSVTEASACGAGASEVQQANLLGVAGHPRVMVYRDAFGYVGRLGASPLEVRARSPRECFDMLRDACRQFSSKYGTPWKSDQCKAETLEPARPAHEEMFRYEVRDLADRGRFWKAGAVVSRAWSAFEAGRSELAAHRGDADVEMQSDCPPRKSGST